MTPRAFREEFEAYVRSKRPSGLGQGDVVRYSQRDPDVERDSNFAIVDGSPVIEIYRALGPSEPGDPIVESCLLAHGLAQFQWWQRQPVREREELQNLRH